MEPSWDIVVIARDVWGNARRRRHFLAEEWAKKRKVLFVEPSYSIPRKFTGRDPQPGSEGVSISRAMSPPREVQPNIHVMTPLKLFPSTMVGIGALNPILDASRIRSAMRRLDMKNPVLWITPEYGVHYVDRLPHSIVVYDVMDDWNRMGPQNGEKKQIVSDDQAMLKEADVVFAVSRILHDLKSTKCTNCHLMPNGVKLDMYEELSGERPEELVGIPRPIVGFVGMLDPERLDIKMISKVAEMAGDKFSLAFIGPDKLSHEARLEIDSYDSVFLRPPVPYERIPHILSYFNICMIPQRVSPLTNSLDPLKVYEYLATGKPIISTPVDGVTPLEKYVHIVPDAKEFYLSVLGILAGEDKSSSQIRKEAAKEYSWARRVEEIDRILGNALSK